MIALKIISSLVLIFFVFFLDVFSSVARLNGKIHVNTCEKNSEIVSGPYKLINNTWNTASNIPYRSCISLRQMSKNVDYRWRWDYPIESHSGVQAYPSIRFGQSPWYTGIPSTTDTLPTLLDDIRRLKVHYRVKEQARGGWYNLAVDGWIVSSKKSTPEDIRYEYMVWEKYREGADYGKYIGALETENGGEYRLYTKKYTWGDEKIPGVYIVFVKTEQRTEGTIDLDELLGFARKNGVIPPGLYLSDIEFGNEIASGSGMTTVSYYHVDIDSSLATHLPGSSE